MNNGRSALIVGIASFCLGCGDKHADWDDLARKYPPLPGEEAIFQIKNGCPRERVIYTYAMTEGFDERIGGGIVIGGNEQKTKKKVSHEIGIGIFGQLRTQKRLDFGQPITDYVIGFFDHATQDEVALAFPRFDYQDLLAGLDDPNRITLREDLLILEGGRNRREVIKFKQPGETKTAYSS